MKKLMTLLLAFMGLTANAQQTDQLTATLQAGDQTTVFYGIEAFKQAVEASPEGGVITLSREDSICLRRLQSRFRSTVWALRPPLLH